jgi:hypothetical protein
MFYYRAVLTVQENIFLQGYGWQDFTTYCSLALHLQFSCLHILSTRIQEKKLEMNLFNPTSLEAEIEESWIEAMQDKNIS